MKLCQIFIYLFLTVNLVGQFNNKVLFGEKNSAVLDFTNGNPIVINNDKVDLGLYVANASMCDEDGNLLFYTNGCHVYNKNFEIMENGSKISNRGDLHSAFCGDSGSPVNGSVYIVPREGYESQYFLIHTDYINAENEAHLYYSIIDMSKEEGLGEVVEKSLVVLKAPFSRMGMALTRHANGIDWWIVYPKFESNCYYIFLLNSDGITFQSEQCLGNVWDYADIQGQSTFSPNGKYYTRFLFQNGLNLFHFDNLNGILSNHIKVEFDFMPEIYYTGVGISPNSRFLYASAFNKLYQYDLSSENFANSRLLVADLETRDSLQFQTRFNRMFLGPNGKFYIGGTLQFNYLHVINNPDCKGRLCDLEQYAIRLYDLPGNSSFGVPILPHINVEPQDIDCDTVQIMSSVNEFYDIENHFKHTLYPNPSSSNVSLSIPNFHGDYEVTFYNLTGTKQILIQSNSQESNINISSLIEGVYFYNIIVKGNKVASGKFIKIK